MDSKLTADERRVLNVFASLYGRTWKSKLRTVWMHGALIDGSDDAALLYSLRNSDRFGPAGLLRYRAVTF
jgi:hypothetical protein